MILAKDSPPPSAYRCLYSMDSEIVNNIRRQDWKQLHDGIAAEVEVAYNNFQEAQQKFLSAQKTVELAEEALRLANLMYDEGASTQLDVLNSRLALTRARMSYATSLFEYEVARYQLRKVTGQLEGVI